MIHHLISADHRLSIEDLITMHCQIWKIKQIGRKLIISCLTDCNENSTKISRLNNRKPTKITKMSRIIYYKSCLSTHTANYFYIFTTEIVFFFHL
jgi:hypothetical protein